MKTEEILKSLHAVVMDVKIIARFKLENLNCKDRYWLGKLDLANLILDEIKELGKEERNG